MNLKENLAIVFPGQGSQKVGMLGGYADSDILKSTFNEASEVLGYDVWEAIKAGPQEKLNLTEITQPVLLAASIVLWRIWQDSNGSTPKYLAGHSLGEWTALAAAGVVGFQDAIRLVRLRGRFMQDAVPEGEGAMAAIIGLAEDVVQEICREISKSGVVSPVNYNSPGQLVIAGSADPVARAVAACQEAGARKAIPLAVSAPFHTSLMKPAAELLSQEIHATEFNPPQIPVVHNVHAQIEVAPAKIKSIIVEQIYKPVRWVSCMQFLVLNKVDQVVECGPGKVLCGLNRRIDKSIESYATESPELLASTLEATH